MSPRRDIRSAISQSQINESGSNIFIIEIFIVAIVCGVAFQSWWIFGLALILLCIILSIKVLSGLFVLLLSLGWGCVGYGIGFVIGSTGAMVVMAIIGFLIGLGVHMSGLQWFKDITND